MEAAMAEATAAAAGAVAAAAATAAGGARRVRFRAMPLAWQGKGGLGACSRLRLAILGCHQRVLAFARAGRLDKPSFSVPAAALPARSQHPPLRADGHESGEERSSTTCCRVSTPCSHFLPLCPADDFESDDESISSVESDDSEYERRQERMFM